MTIWKDSTGIDITTNSKEMEVIVIKLIFTKDNHKHVT